MKTEELAFVLRCQSALGTSLQLKEMCTRFLTELVRGSTAIGGEIKLINESTISVGKTCSVDTDLDTTPASEKSAFNIHHLDNGNSHIQVRLKKGNLNLFFKDHFSRLSFYGNTLSGIAGRIDTAIEACQSHEKLRQAQEELRNMNASLEETVKERTSELNNALIDLKIAQTEIVQQEKLAVLGKLSAGIAHEMNTPLGAVISSTDNLSTILRTMFKDGLKGVDHSIVMEACKLADDFTAHDTLTSRQERAERKMLEAHLRDEYGLEAMASEHATLLVECGVLAADKEILDHVYGAQDVEMALGVTVTIMKIRKSVSTIEVAAQKAASVIRALKTYVRNEDVQSATVFDVRRSINDVLLLFGSQLKKGVELHLEMDKQLLLQGNESELSKVWSNLIANALYAMDNNGNLWIAGTTDDKNIILTFSNDGPAIPEEVMSKLFEPFYTTKPVGEGSGMGMSIVFNIVASMNGSIEAETGDRTTFTVTLPKTPMQ